VVIVSERRQFIIERDEKYHRTLPCGIRYLNPFSQKIVFVHSMEEQKIMEIKETATCKEQYRLTMDVSKTVKVSLR